MADYSKEFDPENGDFSIKDELDRLEPNQSVHLRCEGYGFTQIAKNIKGEAIIGFKGWNSDQMRWIPFTKLNKNTKVDIWKK